MDKSIFSKIINLKIKIYRFTKDFMRNTSRYVCPVEKFPLDKQGEKKYYFHEENYPKIFMGYWRENALNEFLMKSVSKTRRFFKKSAQQLKDWLRENVED